MKVPNNPDTKEKCICPNCPTHNSCMKEKKEKFFCSLGKSGCGFDRQGCICGECPVASDYSLNDLYFCESGAAK